MPLHWVLIQSTGRKWVGEFALLRPQERELKCPEMRESTFLRRSTGRHDILRVRLIEEKMVETADTVFNFEAETLNGQPKKLAEYLGRVLLIVNTASQCGFTPQYAGLEKLYLTY